MIKGEWKNGTPKEVLVALRPGGWVRGYSKFFPNYLTLHKTDFSRDLRTMKATDKVLFRIDGNPNGTGRYDPDRRTITVWLGE